MQREHNSLSEQISGSIINWMQAGLIFFLFKIIPVRHLFDDKIRHNCFSEAKQPICVCPSREIL